MSPCLISRLETKKRPAGNRTDSVEVNARESPGEICKYYPGLWESWTQIQLPTWGGGVLNSLSFHKLAQPRYTPPPSAGEYHTPRPLRQSEWPPGIGWPCQGAVARGYSATGGRIENLTRLSPKSKSQNPGIANLTSPPCLLTCRYG